MENVGDEKQADFALNTHPTLVVGLGGAGGQIVARVKKLVNEMYADRDDITRLVQYMVIDADQYASLDRVTRSQIDRDREFFMISGFNPLKVYREIMDGGREYAEDLQRWMPPYAEFREYLRDSHVIDGASRARPLGRFYLYWHRAEVERRLREKVDRCFAPGPDAQVNTRSLRVLICSSCCGGTGSSAFFDVVYMLHRILRHSGRDVSIEAYIPLPEPFIRAAVKGNASLEHYLRANAFGFFRELDYIQKHPEKMDVMSFDYVSGRRHAPPSEGNGLPPRMGAPIRATFMVDEEVEAGGVGMFRYTQDVFDFTARMIAWSQFEPQVLSGIRSKVSNIEAMASLDRKHRRPKRYAAIGFSELAFPTDLLTDYFTRLAGKRGIEAMVLGEPFAKDREMWDESARLIVSEIHDRIFKSVDSSVTLTVDEALATLVPLSTFTDRRGRPDRDRITADGLLNALTTAKSARNEGIVRIDTRVHKLHELMFGIARSIFGERVDLLMNGFGLRALDGVFEIVNNTLEKTIETWKNKIAEKDKDIAVAIEQALGGSDTNPPIIGDILKFKRDAREKLVAYINGVDAYARLGLESRALELKIDLLAQLVGDARGADPVPFEFSPARGVFVPGTRSEKSMLDELRLQIGEAIRFFDRRAREIRPAVETRDNEAVAGRSPTTRYIPSYFNHPNWDEHPEVRKRFEALFPYLAADNSPKRAQERAEMLLALLASLKKEVGWSVAFGLSETEELADLESAWNRFAREKARTGLSANILDLLKGENAADELVRNLHENSKVAFRFDDSRFTDGVDLQALATLNFFGGPEGRKSEKFAPAGVEVFRTLPDRLIVLRVLGIMPFWSSKTLAVQERSYAQRELNNFPHIVHQFNLGQLEIEDRFKTSSPDPVVTFLKLYALSKWMVANPTKVSHLSGVLDFDQDAIDLRSAREKGWRPGFVCRETTPRRTRRTWGMIWQEAERPDGGLRLSPGQMVEIFDFESSFERFEDAVRRYRRSSALFEHHAKLVEALESSESTTAVLREAAASLLEECRTAYLKLGNMVGSQTAAVPRDFTSIRDVNRANLDFFGRAVEILKVFTAEPEPDPTPFV